MKSLSVLFFFFIVFANQAQDNDYFKEIAEYRKELNEEFLDPDSSPLKQEDRIDFKEHDFFPVDEKYKVLARFEPTPNARPFPLKTSTGSTQLYRRLGILHFKLDGEDHQLEAYLRVQSFALSSKVNYVFLPIIDTTTGISTYSAGRYLHYEGIPEGEEWVIDFNKLYNPLCAYNENYECPLVPEANHLSIAIEAGVKDYSPNSK